MQQNEKIPHLESGRRLEGETTISEIKQNVLPSRGSGLDKMPIGLMRSLERGARETQKREGLFEDRTTSEKTPSTEGPGRELTTQTTRFSTERPSSGDVARLARTSERTSIGSVPGSVEVLSPSMNLIDDSVECIFQAMDDLRAKSLSQDNINTSVTAIQGMSQGAKQIYALMRLKLDLKKWEKKTDGR